MGRTPAQRNIRTQISKIYRVPCALSGLPFDQVISPFEIERLTGVSRETVLTYCHYALFYQNFWPRVALTFTDESSSVEKVKILKKSFPAAFDLYCTPEESIILRLLMLRAYGDRYITQNSLQLNSQLEGWLELLRDSGLIDIKGKRMSLTNKGMSNAFAAENKFSSLRANCFVDIQNIANILNHPTITFRLPLPRTSYSPYCDLAPNSTLCSGGLAKPPYLELIR